MQDINYETKHHQVGIDHNKEEELLSDLEGERKSGFDSWFGWLIAVVAFSWSAFQLYIAYFPLNTILARSVHLSFALFLAFLLYGFLKKKRLAKPTVFDWVFAVVGAVSALYIFINYDALSGRHGDYIWLDITVAVIAVTLLLEASRRVLGIALAIIAIVFLAYAYFGQYMPMIIAHQGASLHKLAGQMFLTSEGIFGIPLGVSTDFIFLFVLFGAMLERAGAGEYFINLAYALLGKYRGGPAKASVAASGMTGIISGSSTANVVTTGNFTIPLMKRSGFSGEKAAAVEVAASTNGQLMPPIMGAAAFIIAEFLGLAYSQVIMAAIIPAVVSYIALFYVVHLESVKMGLKGERKENLPPKLATFLSGLHYLLPIIYLMYLLIVEQRSPVYAGFFAVLTMMGIMLIQHPIKALIQKRPLRKGHFAQGVIDIFHGMVIGAKNMIPIAIATAAAGIIVGTITLTGLGLFMTEVIQTIAGNNILLILLLVALMSLILGMGLPTTANYIIVSAMTVPVISELSVANGYMVPLIALHLFVFYFGILADDTPPVGIAAYAGAAIAKSDPIKTGVQGFIYDMRTAILPFMFFFNPNLVLLEPGNPDDFYSEFMMLDWVKYESNWTWITNPFDIAVIFTTAILGMFAFATASQGYYVIRTTIIERLLFVCAIPLFFLPNVAQKYLHLPSEYLSYLLGLGIFAGVYGLQKLRQKKQGG
ncbi:MAG: TRAP transporter permease [Campylobacterota bacterium]